MSCNNDVKLTTVGQWVIIYRPVTWTIDLFLDDIHVRYMLRREFREIFLSGALWTNSINPLKNVIS